METSEDFWIVTMKDARESYIKSLSKEVTNATVFDVDSLHTI